jgi:hypothetical protein
MKAWKNRCDRQFEDGLPSKQRRRAFDQLAIGAIILLWGVLLALKQVGIIERSVSTWPFALAAFGVLLVIGGVYRLIRPI